jgi:YihY family inner membrane protein
MNPIEHALRKVDRWQQRHPVTAFIVAVIKKFGDDGAANHVALLTYFAFLATFPLLLALTGVVGLVLRGHPGLQHRLEDSALAEFPIIGNQLHSQIGSSLLHHSGPALVIGIVGAVLGARGLANAVQKTLNDVWHVPQVERPGFPWKALRTLGLLALMGVGVVLTAVAASLAGTGEVIGLHGVPVKGLAFSVATVIYVGLFLATFRIAVARTVATRDLVLGAVMCGVAWQILLALAGVIVSHDLRHAHAVAGVFGVVLGLLAWFGLQATVTLYAVEADVVRARHLWPRSLTQPPLTDADKAFLTKSAETDVRRPEQRVEVEFTLGADRDPLREPAADG